MKLKKILILLLLMTAGRLFAQTDFQPGYIILENGDTIHGSIDYRSDNLMSEICRFKSLHSDSIIIYLPVDLKEFRFENSKCYVSRILESGRTVFLEYLINGKLNVYYFRDEKGDEYYLVEKKDFPLKAIPYREEIRYKENGTRGFYQSTYHIGILNLYTQDAPDLDVEAKFFNKKPDHQNLVNFAKEYHETICKDEECIIYEKEVPLIKASIEIIYSLSFYNKRFFSYNLSNDFGANIFINMPRTSEKIYFKTGVFYSSLKDYDNKYFIKIPTQLYYQYSHSKLRPNFCLGSNHYLIKSEKLSYLFSIAAGIGVNYKFAKNVSASLNINTDFTPIAFSLLQESTPAFLSYSFNLGLRIDL